MKTPVEVLLAVAGIGGGLGIAGDKLRMLLFLDTSFFLPDSIYSITARKNHKKD